MGIHHNYIIQMRKVFLPQLACRHRFHKDFFVTRNMRTAQYGVIFPCFIVRLRRIDKVIFDKFPFQTAIGYAFSDGIPDHIGNKTQQIVG